MNISLLFNRIKGFAYYVINKNIERRWWKEYSKGVKLKKLSKEQEEAIQSYYVPLIGKKINTKWHQLLYSITGVFNVKYLPFDLYQKIANTLCPWDYHKILDDKNMYRSFFHGFNLPPRVLECSGGVYFLPMESDNEVTLDEAISYCANISDCIIKPSRDSSAGNGVKLFITEACKTLDGKDISSVFKRYGKNFLIERKISNCEELKAFNPTSLNTFRIITYRDITGKPRYLKSFLRIGRMGKIIDNASAGGIVVPVDKDGNFSKEGYTTFPYSILNQSDSGIEFAGYQFTRFPELVKEALNAHSRMPFFNLVGWDITIDDNNNIVIVECNPPCDMKIGQVMFRTSYLSDFQDEILKRVFQN